MGTNYKLYEDDIFGELSISEMSNKLSFLYDDSLNVPSYISDELTPEELAKVLLKGLTVCSYWMDTDELKELIKDHMYHKI